jgi:tetratricopeptide (TPR) repeat protein
VIRLAIAFGAFSSGDHYRAYDESALEALLGFYGSYLEGVGRAALVDVDKIKARSLRLALALMLSIEDAEPELAVVGDARRSIQRVESVGVFRGMYLLWRMTRKLRRLSVATRSLLSVRFLEGEILALRSKIGSRRSLTKAREAFSALTNDAPWLATAFAWLYYIEKNLGDNDAAETALRRAENLAPSNKFVREASDQAQEIGRSERFGSAEEYDRAAQEARQSHVPPDRWVMRALWPKDVVFEEELAVPEKLCVD